MSKAKLKRLRGRLHIAQAKGKENVREHTQEHETHVATLSDAAGNVARDAPPHIEKRAGWEAYCSASLDKSLVGAVLRVSK